MTKISIREVSRRYFKLKHDLETSPFYISIDLTNRVNNYICTICNYVTKTKDIDRGVTPMFHTCAHCKSRAASTMYRDTMPELEPIEEWYRPSFNEILKMRNKPEVLEHVLMGGLLNRKIKEEDK